MERLIEQAPAKVNLWLNVVGRRADGYHLLHSLVAFTDLADELTAEPSDRLTLTLDGPGAAALANEPDNLVLKAARLLAEETRLPPHAALRLTKRIPTAAGLGGGSADAAATLRALGSLWSVRLAPGRLQAIATRLGADVPMCLTSRPAVASGVGEVLQPAPALPVCAVLLFNPGVALATPAVFAARRGDFSMIRAVRPWATAPDFVAALAERGNDLTGAAIDLQPVVGEALTLARSDPRARYVAMSGSGATCFALYDSPEDASRGAARLPAAWWRHVGRFA